MSANPSSPSYRLGAESDYNSSSGYRNGMSDYVRGGSNSGSGLRATAASPSSPSMLLGATRVGAGLRMSPSSSSAMKQHSRHHLDQFRVIDDDIGAERASRGVHVSNTLMLDDTTDEQSSAGGLKNLIGRWLWGGGGGGKKAFHGSEVHTFNDGGNSRLLSAADAYDPQRLGPTVHIPANRTISEEELSFAAAMRRQAHANSVHGGLLGALGGRGLGNMVAVGTYGHGYGHGGFGAYGPLGRYYGAGDHYAVTRHSLGDGYVPDGVSATSVRRSEADVLRSPSESALQPPSPTHHQGALLTREDSSQVVSDIANGIALSANKHARNGGTFLRMATESPGRSLCGLKMDVFDKCLHTHGGDDSECLHEWKEYVSCQEVMPGSVI